MKVISKEILVKPEDYFTKHLKVINGIFADPCQMTNKEIEIIASFMSLHKELTRDSLFNTQARKRVLSSLGLIPAGLSHHIRSLRNKGHVYRDEKLGVLKIRDYLFPEEGGQGYQFKLRLIELGKK